MSLDISADSIKTDHLGLGPRVRHLRLAFSLTQKQLGIQIGSNAETIQKIENGHSRFPRLIVDLAFALGVNPAWLLFGDHCADQSWPK